MEISSRALTALCPLLSIGFHELVLRRAEVDHLVLPGVVFSSLFFLLLTFSQGIGPTVVLYIAFWGTLSLWILLYRAFWHPLRHFPGPFGAKLSKLWTVKQAWDSRWHWHRVQQHLQKQYGDYVRTGPREISIYDPSAIQPLLGFSSLTTKGPFYDVMEKSLHLNRDKVFHRQRRRVWDNGMKESLATFSPLVEEFTEKLLAQLHKQNGEPIELLRYCSYYSYDVMSKLAFGDSMGFVEGKQSEVAASILNTFNSSLSAMGLMYHMPWLMNTLGVVTSIAGPMKEWQDWSVSQMKQRIARKDGKADFVGHLIKNTPENTAGLELLYGESRLIISAGSETTSSALTFTLMQLATNPKYVDAIRKEFRDCVSFNCNRPLPMLDAVIQESMRLWPSIFFAPQRVTPPSGLHINSHFIPGNTIVQMPPFATFRDSRNFVKPDEFVPERWTSQPELVLNKNAFIPFSTGPYNCVGKTLANMELRSVIARVVNEFDLRLPDGFVAEQYWDGIKDQFTAGPPAEQRLSFVKCES